MSSDFRNLYVFGDSYSTTDYCVPWLESFWGLLAQRLNCDYIHNYSQLGNSLDMIMQMITSQQSQILHSPDTLILVCVPPLERFTWHDMRSGKKESYDLLKVVGDVRPSKVEIQGHQGLVTEPDYNLPDLARRHERSWVECQGLRDLFLLHHYLEAQQTPFMLLNMCFKFIRQPGWPTDFFSDWFEHKDNVIFFEGTYASINQDINPPVDFDTHGWQGHHGPAGNQRFFEMSLWPKLESYVKRLRS